MKRIFTMAYSLAGGHLLDARHSDDKEKSVHASTNKSSLKAIILLLIIFLLFIVSLAQAATITISTSINWSAINTGSGPGGQPNASDNITVRGGATLTVNVTNALCGNLQLGGIASNQSGTLAFATTGNPSLTVTNNVQVGGYGNTNRTGTITFQNGSSLTSGSISLGGTGATPAAGIITMTAGSTLTTGSFAVNTVTGNTWTPGTGTVIMNATNTLPATIFASFNNLTISNGTTTLGVGLTITGLLTINSGCTWGNAGNYAVNFRNGITNNGTFNAGTGIQSFTNNSQALNGNFSIPNVTITTITLTNNNSLTVSNALSGSGGLTQATNATLNIGGTSGVTTLTATNSGNTVNYSGSAQTVHANSYYNLILSGSGTKTFNSSISINGNLSINSGVKADLGSNNHTANTLTLGGNGVGPHSWGSTASGALNQNDTYFLYPSTGIINITNSSCSSSPAPPVSLGNQSMCSGQPAVPALQVTVGSGETADWYSAASGGLPLLANSTSFAPPGAGTYYAEARNIISGCVSTTRTGVTLTVNPLPVPTISGPALVCVNSIGNTYNTETGMTGYVWSVSPGGTITSGGGPGDNSVTVTWNTSGAQSVSVLYTNGFGCSAASPISYPVTVSPLSVGGTATAGSPSICSGTSTTVTVSGYTGSIQWQQSPNGSSGWVNVTGGSGSTSPTYTTPNLTTTTYYRAMITSGGCSSDYSTTALITITPTVPVSITISASANPVCYGTAVTFTATPTNGGSTPGYQWKVNGINAGVNNNIYSYTPANGDIVTCVLTSNVTCPSGNPATSNSITMTINPTPTISATGNPLYICSGDPTILNAQGFNQTNPSTKTIGTGGYYGIAGSWSPYWFLYGGNRTQYLIRAGELTAAGFSAGMFTSVAFNVEQTGTTYNSFSIYMTGTSLSDLSGGLLPLGQLTKVFSAASVTPVLGVNTYTLSTPLYWNGTDNIVIQTSFSNNNGGGNSANIYGDYTSYISYAVFYADNETPDQILGGDFSTPATDDFRPQMTLGWIPEMTNSLTWVWNPGNLSGKTVTVNPGSTTTYTVTGTTAAGCNNSAAVTINVVGTPMSGSYIVGSGGDYSSLSNAVDAYNKACLSGPVIFYLKDANYSASETFPITIANNYKASPTNTLTIKPLNGVNATISGSVPNKALINILNSYTIIDGSNITGGITRNLTISNTSTAYPSVILFGSSNTTPIQGSSLMNTTIINGSTNSSAVVVSDGSVIGSAGYFNNITLQNNSIQKAYIGIYCRAVKSGTNGNGTIIKSNNLTTSGSNAIYSVGIYLEGINGGNISQNSVANLSNPNTGIWLAYGNSNGIVEKNYIYNLNASGYYATQGISISSETASSNNTIRNNIIYNITGTGYNYTSTSAIVNNPIGIVVFGNQSGINIYFNSIYLYGNTLNNNNALSAGIALGTGSTASIMNNIIENNLGRLGGTGIKTTAIWAQTGSTQFASNGLDYNDYYVNPSGTGTKYIGLINTTGYTTVAAWKTATGQESHSIDPAADPLFNSTTDLHITNTNSPCSTTGVTITGITDDIDGDSRPASNPDIGADQFNIWLTWNGSIDTDWGKSGNWSPTSMGPPSVTEIATIPAGRPNYPVIDKYNLYHCRNLIINSGGSVTINPGNSLDIRGTLTLNGTNCMIIQSDATGTGSLKYTSLAGTGTAKVQQYLTPACWHYITSPISDGLSGVFLKDWLRYFIELSGVWSGYITPTTDPLPVLRGYEVWSPWTTPGSGAVSTKNFSGHLNSGNLSIGVTRTVGAGGGWNLTGNPFPCPIDIASANITWTNINPIVYYWDPALGNYYAYIGNPYGYGTGTEYCPPMQGFFVEVNNSSTTGTFGVNNNVMTIPPQASLHNFYKSSEAEEQDQHAKKFEKLLLQAISSQNSFIDKSLICFNQHAKAGFDESEDAYKWIGTSSAPQLYSKADSIDVCVNSLPWKGINMVIPLYFSCGLSGGYVLAFDSTSDLPQGKNIWLEDKKLHIVKEFSPQRPYKFDYVAGEDPARFVLHFKNVHPGHEPDDPSLSNGNVTSNMPAIQVYSYMKTVYVRNDNAGLTGDVSVYNLLGTVVYRGKLAPSTINIYQTDLPTGIYVVNVITPDGTVNQKVVIR